MSFMLPSALTDHVSLADVVPSCFRALGWGFPQARLDLPQAETIVLVVVDGLGLANVESSSAYLRFIAPAVSRGFSLQTVFPSTTACALATLVTGTPPVEHGIVGYRIWDEGQEQFVNQLNGLSPAQVDAGWMTRPSLLNQAVIDGHNVYVVGHPRFAHSTLTRMLYGKATYIGSASMEDKFSMTADLVTSGSSGLYVVYISDLDEAAHREGVASNSWLALAEELDAQLKRFVARIAGSAVTLLTADHGVVDVPLTHHREFGLDGELLGVKDIGGEPRGLQIKLDGSLPALDVLARWRAIHSDYSYIDLREAFGFGGSSRAGEIFVMPFEGNVFYDGREPTSSARKMVGQHGGISAAEINIPLAVWDS